MHAVVTHIELPEGRTVQEAREAVEGQVLPRLRAMPGVVSAVFLAPASGRDGFSVVVFDTEESARAAQPRMEPPPPVRLVRSEIREVVGTL